MPYFVVTTGESLSVVVLPPGKSPPNPDSIEINRETAIACELRNGQRITTEQLAALRTKSISAFRASQGIEQPAQRLPDEPVSTGFAAQYPPTVGQALPAPVAGRMVPVQAARQSSTSRRANSVAGVVEGICWLFLVVSVVLGIVIAAQSRVSDLTGEREHPYVAAGISIAVVGCFEALVVIMFAAYIKARTESSFS
jgi:hypothetical protein